MVVDRQKGQEDKGENKLKDLKFEKPTSVVEISNDGYTGNFLIKPLERGYGITLGNALRRVLLSSLPGAAIVNVKIEGVEHEFSTIEGVVEDVMGIILNLKKVVFKVASEDPRFEQKLELTFMGEGTVTAENFDNVDGVEIINKDQVIAHLSSKGKLMLEVTVRRGVGYVNADTNKSFSRNEKGVIAIDSVYAPVTRVSYHVEKTRGDMDELTLDISTNGAMDSKEALALASKMLIDHFEALVEISETAGEQDFIYEAVEEPMNKKLEMKIYKLSKEEFNIGSPKQLGEILFVNLKIPGGKKTKSGTYSTDSSTLNNLASDGFEIAQLVLDWRELTKLKSTSSISSSISGCPLTDANA